jgi:hypothetical protein
MNSPLSPIESEFATAAEAEPHDRWFRAQVLGSLNDQRPCLAHDQVMAEMGPLIAEAERRQLPKPG